MSSSVDVNAPAARTWALIEDADRWPEWSDVCLEVWGAPPNTKAVSQPGRGAPIEHGWRRGHRFGFLLRIAGRKIPFFVTIRRFFPGNFIEWQSTKFTITAVRSISVMPVPGGCRVIDSKEFSSYLLPIGLAYPRGVIRKMTDQWLQEVKREAEGRS